MEYNETVYKDLISCLQARAAQFSNAAAIIRSLVETMVAKTKLVNHTTIVTLMDYCWQTNNANVCTALCWRILDHTFLTVEAINRVLMPLLPELVKFVARHKLGLRQLVITDDPFRTVFKNVLCAWGSKVLGAKPPDASARLALAQKNTCPCAECRKVVEFMTGKTIERVLHLARIGALKRKHVEGNLDRYGGASVASYSTIRSTPQGLSVSPLHSSFTFVIAFGST